VNTSNLGLKVLQRDGGQNGVLVNNRSVVNLLVDGDGGVNVGVLDGLPVDDRLDGLVDVVVNVLGGLIIAKFKGHISKRWCSKKVL
jgi:hypothetical protein